MPHIAFDGVFHTANAATAFITADVYLPAYGYHLERLPTGGASVFLAGPTPRSSQVPSWRPTAIDMLESAWRGPGPLSVFTPESRAGKRATEYHHQVQWEHQALDAARVIMFWVPRDITTLPGFTTNVEFGLWAASGKVVLGCPPNCPNPERNRYLIWHAHRLGVPVTQSLEESIDVVLHKLASFANA
jgi:hypothetical protein